MSGIFTQIVDRHGSEGRTEKFVTIEVCVIGDPLDVDWTQLDGRGKKDLFHHTKDRQYEVVSGTAKIAWKNNQARADCIADHQHRRRRSRWVGVQKIAERMKAGEFPQFAHAYLHPSLTDMEGQLMVIDGTRRMLAYLEFGRKEMPVVVIRSASHE